ncbi:AAA family ATPase [Sphingomonas sp.]|uniref:ExeA family protein n=1 Tax=Sphingomonas sp. TaxID=28214 RepID=UPI001EB5020C|nr:AAA family ATPase [Sphingomonas sp.]MBX3595457.1 AAA family ATPase [Sphingomonas sp.]
MYDDHYGLSGRPFQLTPDPAFWFDTATHKKAMAYLGYGLSQGEGFIVITGQPGVGKTTLIGHLMGTIDRERMHVVKLVTTQIEAEDLLHMVAGGLGIDSAGAAKSQVIAAIEKALHAMARAGKRTLLIVDEAQALPIASLEELRMLSNLQAGGYPLLQIFLLGQPEFRARLSDPRLEQLRQRVIAMHQLDPMDGEEVEPYLIHRLSVVGWRGKPRFKNDAVAAIHRWSDGIPRKVNQLAGRVLLFGAIEQIDSFTGADVDAVIADLDSDMAFDGRPATAAAPPPAPATASADPARDPVRPAPSAAAPGADDLVARIARLEGRLEEQDAALRRVLTLMVDFIEAEDARPSARRGTAA